MSDAPVHPGHHGVAVGIHLGHDAGCAVVVDGELAAAVQQERLTLRKHDGEEVLTNRLPLAAALQAAGATMADVGAIVTSAQGTSPGGQGLHRPLIEDEFSLFDPHDRRHVVVSHHLAHAACAWGSAAWSECACIVCDLGGSSTLDGEDFLLAFGGWRTAMEGPAWAPTVRTECLSIYGLVGGRATLLDREFVVPHNQPESFVQNLASLYDNVARCVFGGEHNHGQLMALAAYRGGPDDRTGEFEAADLVTVDGEQVIFRNDWQHRVPWGAAPLSYAGLARACQAATESVGLAYGRRARRLTGSSRLAVSGGTFLNIPLNSALAAASDFSEVHVPSAPHDAGVAVGCAFLGASRLGSSGPRARPSDRLGRSYRGDEVAAAIDEVRPLVERAPVDIAAIARQLAAGAVVARWEGRAEFGPRALGGRSLLAAPFEHAMKDRLNRCKGRQPWRPVAPVVLEHDAERFFDGPPSPFMSFTHLVREEHRAALAALEHPDATTRAQTLRPRDDEQLAAILTEFGRLTGYPVLVNTSLNGRGEPIVETPLQAIRFRLREDDVTALVLGGHVLRRRPDAAAAVAAFEHLELAPGVVISHLELKHDRRVIASLRQQSMLVGAATLELLERPRDGAVGDVQANELYGLFVRGIVRRRCAEPDRVLAR